LTEEMIVPIESFVYGGLWSCCAGVILCGILTVTPATDVPLLAVSDRSTEDTRRILVSRCYLTPMVCKMGAISMSLFRPIGRAGNSPKMVSDVMNSGALSLMSTMLISITPKDVSRRKKCYVHMWFLGS